MKGIDITRLNVSQGRPKGQNITVMLKSLPLNQGFTIESLVNEWGYSPSTIERAAIGLKCIRHVEMSDGSAMKLVMNPATAAEKTRR